jgi:hypothetical protein
MAKAAFPAPVSLSNINNIRKVCIRGESSENWAINIVHHAIIIPLADYLERETATSQLQTAKTTNFHRSNLMLMVSVLAGPETIGFLCTVDY